MSDSVQAWAPVILDEAKRYIAQNLESLPEGVYSFEFERNDIETYLAATLSDAPRGAIVGALNRFLKPGNGIERVKRGFYKAYPSDTPVLLADEALKDSIEYLETQIIGASTYDEDGLTESDIAMISGIYRAIKILRATLSEIEEIEGRDEERD